MNTENRIYPKPGQIYTLAGISKLFLRDSPALCFYHNHVEVCIQDTWVTEEEVCKNPLLADSKWKYRLETDEWIPVFYYADDQRPITDLVTIEKSERDGNEHPWVCWIGHHSAELSEYEKQAQAEDRKKKTATVEVAVEPEVVLPASAAVVEPPVDQNRHFTNPAEYTQDHDKAVAYLANRKNAMNDLITSLQWEQLGDESRKAKIYTQASVVALKDSFNWGYLIWNDPVKDSKSSVIFKTYECFLAYVLATWW